MPRSMKHALGVVFVLYVVHDVVKTVGYLMVLPVEEVEVESRVKS